MSYPRPSAVLLALLAAGCTIDLKSLAPFPCGADSSCPAGFSCNADGQCVAGGTAPGCTLDADCQAAGTWCREGACAPCDSADHCGAGCVACKGSFGCGGAEVGCLECDTSEDCPMSPAVCRSHLCACASGTTRCSDACVDLATSADHCGACGKACPKGQKCQAKACLATEVCDNGSDDDGDGAKDCDDPECAATAACRTCDAGQKRCAATLAAVETCSADGWTWSAKDCPRPGRCDPATLACVPSSCTPGEVQCVDSTKAKVCSPDGSKFVDTDCRKLDAFSTPAARCQSNACVDPCADAARAGSYQGCEFWTAVTSNSQLDSSFKGGVTDGVQGDATSDFAIVLVNSQAAKASVRITRKKGGAEQAAPSSPPPGADGAIAVAPGSTQTVFLPWQAVGATGLQPFAYHVVSDLPVAAYQFNPLDAYTGGSKQGEPCSNCSYTADASMLLPVHGLGSTYVLAGQPHVTLVASTTPPCETNEDCPGAGNACVDTRFLGKACKVAPTFDAPAFFAVVGIQDGTKVTVRFSTATLASKSGASVAAQAAGSTGTYTLGRYEVLQFWTAAGTTKQCGAAPSGGSFAKMCVHDSDPTGTVVHASDAANPAVERPVAVLAGADCSFTPFDQFACDHLEEMVLPLRAWGKRYAVSKSAPYCTATGPGRCAAPVAAPAPDRFRVVSGCTKDTCPSGTKVTLSPPPTGLPGSICTGGTCTLPPMAKGVDTAAWIEFDHAGGFSLAATSPVLLAQYFTGQTANPGAAEGDPSLVFAAPVEQWRTSYDLLTSPTLVHNYLSLVGPSAANATYVDGNAVNATNFPGLLTTSADGFTAYQVPVTGGAHSVLSNAALGATVYGYDSFISYGYLGGSDLKAINTLPAP